MTLPSSPPIAASQIRNELGLSDFRMNRTAERALAEKPSGGYSFREFLGKTYMPPRPIAWTGPPTQTIGFSSAGIVRYVISSYGEVSGFQSGLEGTAGYWTQPPVFAYDGVEVRATIEEGGAVNGVTGTWVDLNAPDKALSISKTTGSPTTLLIEIRRNGGPVQASWRVTLVV